MAKDKNSSGIARATTSGGTASTRGRGAGGGSDTIASSTSGGSASASAGGSDGTPDSKEVRLKNLKSAQSEGRFMTPDEAASYYVPALEGTAHSYGDSADIVRLGRGEMNSSQVGALVVSKNVGGRYTIRQRVMSSSDFERKGQKEQYRVFAVVADKQAAIQRAKKILQSAKATGFDGQLLLNSGEVSAERTRIRGMFSAAKARDTPNRVTETPIGRGSPSGARTRTSPTGRRQSTIEPSSGARNGPAAAPRATAPVAAPAPRGPRGATPAGLRRSGPGNRRVSLPNAPGMPRGAGGTARRERANKAYRKLEREAQSLAAAQSGAKDSMRRAVSNQRRQELNRDIGDMRAREVQVRNRLTKAVRNSRAIEKSRAASRRRRSARG